MIKPTVGRIVLYHPGPNDTELYDDKHHEHPVPAIVIRPIDDRNVDLVAFTWRSNINPAIVLRSIKLCQDDDQPEQYMAEWMPYQIGQAKKYEEAASPVLDARLAKIEQDQLELDRRLKTVETPPVEDRPVDVPVAQPAQDNNDSTKPSSKMEEKAKKAEDSTTWPQKPDKSNPNGASKADEKNKKLEAEAGWPHKGA